MIQILIFIIYQGAYTENTDIAINRLTQEDILEAINNKNTSGIFMKEFNFVELLGDIRYDETGRIIGKESIAIKIPQFLVFLNLKTQ